MARHPAPRNWDAFCLWTAGALFLLGTAVVFTIPADLLFGSAQADLGQQFLAWRAFAASSLKSGHLPLWNPYSYSGEPFLAGFQSALFYAPNLVFLALPLCRAVNFSILLHLFVLGWGMRRWAAGRGFHPLAGGLCGLVLPLSGTVFPHLYAGHLSNLCALAWTPWILSGLDRWHRQGARRGLLLAGAGAALQVFAGHPQYAYCTAIAALAQAIAFALAEPASWRRAVSGAPAVFAGGAALAAAQLLPGLAAAGESLRGGGLDPAASGQFSFPPENALTAVAPGFFGGMSPTAYWGRCYAWEMLVFIGASGAVLLALGAADPVRGRACRAWMGLAAGLILLSLGRHIPGGGLLEGIATGFGRLRGPSKFTFPAAVFLVMAIGAGADALIRGRPAARSIGFAALGSGIVFAAVGTVLYRAPQDIGPLVAHVRSTGESYLPAAAFADPAKLAEAGSRAGLSLVLAGASALTAGAALLASRRRPSLRWAIPALLIAEMAGFAAGQFAVFRVSDAIPAELTAYVASHPGDYRVQNLVGPNNGFLIGAGDIWGNDPALSRRYAEFMAVTQGESPEGAAQTLAFHSMSPLFALLRLHAVFTRTAEGFRAYETPGGLDRVQLVGGYRIEPGRDAVFADLKRTGFDARTTALLESDPGIPPAPVPPRGSNPGSVRVVSSAPDEFAVEADTTAPCILLVTDAYSRDWRAHALPGSGQAEYRVMPADYVLRATPLSAGHHRIVFRYEPRGLVSGILISLAAWGAWAALMALAASPRTRVLSV